MMLTTKVMHIEKGNKAIKCVKYVRGRFRVWLLINIQVFLITNMSNFRLYSKRGDKFGTTSNLQRPSAGQENIYAVDDVPLVENEPGPATNPSQTVTQAAEAPSTEDAESPYGYDTPCDVHPDRMDDAGHYEDYDNDPSNVTENNRNSMALNSEVTPHYTYDTPCEVRIDPADAKMSWYHTRYKQMANNSCMVLYYW